MSEVGTLNPIKKNNRNSLVIGGIIIALIAVVMLSLLFGDTKSRLMRITEQGVRDGLQYDAHEAEFSSKEETELMFYGDYDEYVEVTGWVIASNGYGAKSKVDYTAELEKNESGQWEFDDFELDE